MKIYFPILFLLIVGCSSPLQTDNLLTIDVEKAFNNVCDIFLSDFADEIEYIPLETLTGSVTGSYLRVFATDSYLIAISFRYNQLFDRKTGKFIREIGRFGKGPNDFMATTVRVPFDENRLTIRSTNPQMNSIEYDLEGKVVRTILYPSNYRINVNVMKDMIPLEDKYFVTYINNNTGNEPDKLLVFDDKGNIFNRYPNFHSFAVNDSRSTFSYWVFNKWKNNVFFYENCVDTLFKVTKDDITPYCRFHLGKYNPPYSEKQNLYSPNENPRISNFIVFRTINESERFLFFSFLYGETLLNNNPPLYFGYYDKKKKTNKISNVDHIKQSPVINDLDDFAPWHPFIWSVNQSDEMVAYMEAGDIADWFKKNPEKAKKLPEHLKKLSKLTPEDNPVVIIAKLKI